MSRYFLKTRCHIFWFETPSVADLHGQGCVWGLYGPTIRKIFEAQGLQGVFVTM